MAAVLGDFETPKLKISALLPKYWEISKDKLRSKSPNQIRKDKYPRLRAIRNLINVLGDKEVYSITREDMLKFRDWWITRLEAEKMVVDSANKNFNQLKTVFEAVNDELRVNLDITHLFKNLTIKQRRRKTKIPFETEFLRNTLLREETLIGLNDEAKWALYAISETGYRLTEICGLKPEDIHLDSPIPFIHICDRADKETKTIYSDRQIPLIGFALEAFKKYPKGFPRYFDKADQLSSPLGKYLDEHGLLKQRQTTYSLRHSFQDRLLHANTPGRVQADLMGHIFNRPDYGNGATLQQKFDWVNKIKLKKDILIVRLR